LGPHKRGTYLEREGELKVDLHRRSMGKHLESLGGQARVLSFPRHLL